MTLPTGTISMSQVNTELGLAATTNISLNQANVRALAGVPSGAISMNDLRGKSAVTLVFNNAQTFDVYTDFYGSGGFAAYITINTNGSITLGGGDFNQGPTAYLSPISTGAGTQFQVRAVYSVTGINPATIFGVNYSGSGTTPFYSLGTARTMEVFPSQGDDLTLSFTLEIRNSNTGSTISRSGLLRMFY